MEVDVCVVGAGIVGLSTALILQQHKGLKVVLIDKQVPKKQLRSKLPQQFDSSPWVSALNQRSQQFLKRCGVWEELTSPPWSGTYTRMHVRAIEYAASLNFSAEDAGARSLGTIVDNTRLKALLWKKVDALDTITVKECVPEVWSAARGKLRCQGGDCIQARCLIGADGARSWVRSASEIEWKDDRLEECAWIVTVKHTRMHQDKAMQVFSKLGVVALLPLNSPNMSVCVFSCSQKSQDQVRLFLQDGQILRSFFPDIGDFVCVSDPECRVISSGQAQAFSQKNTILVGDAAVAVHPLAGLGLNMGLRAVDCLDKALRTVSTDTLGQDWQQVSKLYAMLAKPHATATRRFITTCLMLSRSEIGGRALMAMGFGCVDTLGLVRRGIANYAVTG